MTTHASGSLSGRDSGATSGRASGSVSGHASGVTNGHGSDASDRAPVGDERRPSRWPLVLLAFFVTLAVLGTIGTGINGGSVAEQIPPVIAFGMFGVVGALIVSRDSGNRIGALLLYGASTGAVGFVAGELTTYFVVGRGIDQGPLVVATAMMSDLFWVIGILPVLYLLPVLFPTGRPPSPRWRILVVFIGLLVAVLAVSVILGSPELSGSIESASVENPFYSPAFDALNSVFNYFEWVFIAIFGLSVASLILRFRRSRGIERQQIKWFAFACVMTFALLLLTPALGSSYGFLESLLSGLAFLVLPVAVGAAILRYRLFDLDLVVRKTLVVGALGLFIGLLYVGIVAGGTMLLGRDDPTLSVVAAVALALLFQPARAWARRIADRLVYGRRATPYEVMAQFSQRLGDAYEAEDVLARMARVIGEGVGAERADVWLGGGGALRAAAAWPADAGSPTPLVADADGWVDPDGGAVFPVDHRGERLGALSVRKPASDPLAPADRKLVGELAAQAGLVLRNVGLTDELRRRLDELRAAQKRLVSAQDQARRRLERNIHDGAQQQLVALAVKQRLVDQLLDRDPAKAREMLGQLQQDTDRALQDLRDLARGIYPPLLADKGLVAALEAQAAKSLVPTTVSSEGVGRYAQDVEGAAYFSCLEAMQNTAKYADASSASILVVGEAGLLRFRVEDDGRGFDRSAGSMGTGLQGIVDRLAALDGSMTVESAPGAGTVLTGEVPVTPDPAGTAAPAETADMTERGDPQAEGRSRAEPSSVGSEGGVP